MDLFAMNEEARRETQAPLAWRMRPRSLDELIGQEHITGPNSPLRKAIEKDQLFSFMLFGPPGTGKTSIARIIARVSQTHFESLPAVTSGVGDIRKIAADARERQKYYQQATILFVDEIHRFNKGQQDVLLPFVEDGTLILIGATTENPLYELNTALLSRLRLYVLEPLSREALARILEQALQDKVRGLGRLEVKMNEESLDAIIRNSQGDARTALNILDTLANSYTDPEGCLNITLDLIEKVSGKTLRPYDRQGNWHYDCISAYIKSIRGSDPDAALYWLAVMLEGGEDPRFIARRLIVHAAEDIGMADPQALLIASAAAAAVDYVGLPEARIPLAEATIYLSTAPKSNSSKIAIDEALATVRQQDKLMVPPHLADNSHSLAGPLLGKGLGYKYPHNYGGYVEQHYLPEEIGPVSFYRPGTNGYEKALSNFKSDLARKK